VADAKAVATPATKPADAPVAVKAPAAPAPVAAKPAQPVAAKIELPAPVAAVEKTVEQVIEKAADTAVKTIEPVVEATTPVVETPVALIQKEVKTMEANLKNAAEKAQTLFAEANERAKAAVEKGTKLFEEANEFSKGNIEAIVESGKIAAKGFETLGQDAAEYSRKQFEGATAALKSLSTVKSPTDFFKLHSDYVRSSFDSIVAQTSKNTEAMLKLAGEVAQPISNRVALAAEKAKIAA
jgi:phasin family protein